MDNDYDTYLSCEKKRKQIKYIEDSHDKKQEGPTEDEIKNRVSVKKEFDDYGPRDKDGFIKYADNARAKYSGF